jgi:iron-sulfur cluster assembly protein
MVEKGGCAGLQYAMKVDVSREGDTVVEKDGTRVLVDPASVPYLSGSELDYVNALNDSGFKISNPNAVRSCGCGTSFEPASTGPVAAAPPVPDGEACKSA